MLSSLSRTTPRTTRILAATGPRHLSTYFFEGLGKTGLGAGSGPGSGSVWDWPIAKTNTILNIVPQGHKYVVERLGKLHAVQESGYFWAIPFFDKVSYVIDVRERALDIAPQSAITRDNVSVEVAGNLFVRFVDPEKAAYGALNPLYSVTQHAQSAMRSAIGEMELDEILHGRAKLNGLIKGSLQEAAEPWGLDIRRYEITEITPDHQIRKAMDKQAAAERDRREMILRAEGEKRRAELNSEGVKISLTNESEGNLIKVGNEAEASKKRMFLEAQGQAEAIRLTSQAQADALQMIADQLQKPGGEEAARLALAREYVEMYGEMGSKSNTMLFNERPGDVTALMGQAMAAMKLVGNATEGEQRLLPKDTKKQ
jgi:regulator of protease activity HflC (stomatin/prohibitin superfamily)